MSKRARVAHLDARRRRRVRDALATRAVTRVFSRATTLAARAMVATRARRPARSRATTKTPLRRRGDVVVDDRGATATRARADAGSGGARAMGKNIARARVARAARSGARGRGARVGAGVDRARVATARVARVGAGEDATTARARARARARAEGAHLTSFARDRAIARRARATTGARAMGGHARARAAPGDFLGAKPSTRDFALEDLFRFDFASGDEGEGEGEKRATIDGGREGDAVRAAATREAREGRAAADDWDALARAWDEVEARAPARDYAWEVLNSLPSVGGDIMTCKEDEMDCFAYGGAHSVPYIAPEWLERPNGDVEDGVSDNEDEDEDEGDAHRFTKAMRESSSFLLDDEDEFMRTVDAPVDFITEPEAFAARREARALARDAREPAIDFAVKSALLCGDEEEDDFSGQDCSAMADESAYEFQEHFATAADGRVFRVSSALVTPSSSERANVEDSANHRGLTDSEDSDADLVAHSAKKSPKLIAGSTTKRKRRPDGRGRRAKAYKKIKKDKGVCATDVYVMANGKKMRRGCLHCGTVKTPQWRMGPEGKKTLCNACGVRYMKGIL